MLVEVVCILKNLFRRNPNEEFLRIISLKTRISMSRIVIEKKKTGYTILCV